MQIIPQWNKKTFFAISYGELLETKQGL